MHLDDIAKTFGLYEFNNMPFELKNASATFHRNMDNIFRDINCVFLYIDDILIFSNDKISHTKDIEIIFNILHEHNFKISASKSAFNVISLNFLGFQISVDGIKPSNSKKN